MWISPKTIKDWWKVNSKVTAIVLAAGQSRRMGQPKMLLPWGGTTVLGKVIETLKAAGMEDLLVVTGGAREQVEAIVRGSAQVVFNAEYANSEMLGSIQCGLGAVKPEAQAALICLGDQPQIQVRSVQVILQEHENTGASLIVPSYQMKRGHPWLAAREWWDKILEMKPPESPREFLNHHAKEIKYIDVDTPSILTDLDTPEDYLKSHP
jgi:molybdenum cofactor cytidylyltransferase